MTARVVVEGETLKNVTHLPRQVLFEKEGKPVVYVRDGAGFKAAPGEGRPHAPRTAWSLKDFPADADVALVNPERRRPARGRGPCLRRRCQVAAR